MARREPSPFECLDATDGMRHLHVVGDTLDVPADIQGEVVPWEGGRPSTFRCTFWTHFRRTFAISGQNPAYCWRQRPDRKTGATVGLIL
jgi:hypothetical protein